MEVGHVKFNARCQCCYRKVDFINETHSGSHGSHDCFVMTTEIYREVVVNCPECHNKNNFTLNFKDDMDITTEIILNMGVLT